MNSKDGDTARPGVGGDLADPVFWRAGAIATTVVMLIILAFLTIDSYRYMSAGGVNVPRYDVINRHIGHEYNWQRHADVPVIATGHADEARAAAA